MPIKVLRNIVDVRDIRPNLGTQSSTANISTDSPTQLATREIVDVATISLSNITLSGNQTINGFTTSDQDVILVNGQTDKTENGLYTTFSTDWVRVENNLNDVKLVKIVDGDYNTSFWTLINEPVEIDVDDIEYVALYEEGGLNYLQATLTFDETDLVNGKSTFQEIIPGLANNIIDVISCYVKITTSSANTSGGYYVVYENGSGFAYEIVAGLLQGTGTTHSKLFEGSNTLQSTEFASGDGLGLYNPSFIYTSGTIDGTIYLNYRYIAV